MPLTKICLYAQPLAGRARRGVWLRACQASSAIATIAPMQVLDFLQNLPLPSLLAATVLLSFLLCWVIFVLVRLGFRVFGLASAKSLPIHDMVMVTSLMFALMLSFSAAGIWNDWVQARGAVQREALALENVLALADGARARGQGQSWRDRLCQGGGGAGMAGDGGADRYGRSAL